jgi:hypothetical protein
VLMCPLILVEREINTCDHDRKVQQS